MHMAATTIGMAKHDTQAIQNSGIELEDLKSEVAPILAGMGTGTLEKHTLLPHLQGWRQLNHYVTQSQ